MVNVYLMTLTGVILAQITAFRALGGSLIFDGIRDIGNEPHRLVGMSHKF